MNPSRKARLQKIAFVLNGSLFLLGAYGMWEQGKWLFASLQLAAGVLNLLMLLAVLRQRYSHTMASLLLLMNVLVAVSVAVDYFLAGKDYIQYVWLLTALISAVVLLLRWRRGASAS